MSTSAPSLDPASVQQAQGVPVLNPDTGDVHSIPTNMVDQARQAGGKPVAKMLDPQGTARWVSMDQVGDAQKAGGKLVPYGSQSSEQIVQDQTGIHPFTNPIAQVAAGAARGIISPITGAYGAVKAAFSDPTNDEENAAQAAGGPVGLLADRALVQPARRAFQTASSLSNSGHPVAAALAPLGAIPILGGMGQAAGQRAAAGDIPGAVAEGVTDAFMPAALKEAAPAVGRAIAKTPFVQNRTPIPGDNFTPQQHASLSGVLARGSGAGKGYFPKDVASTIGSPLRQAAADNPAIADAVQNGTPEDSLGATQALLSKAQNVIDTQHQAALQPVANTPVSMRPVQNAVRFPSSLSGYAPGDAAAVSDFQQRLGTINTLGDLNDLRMRLSKEDSPTLRQSAIAAGRSQGLDDAIHKAYGAVRDHYYDQLQNATGLDFQGLKRTESGLMSAQEALQNAAPGMASKEAIAGQPRSLRGTAADVVQGANTIKGGLTAGVGQFVAHKVLGETPMTPVQEGLQNFFSDLPKPSTYRGPLTSQYAPPQQALPANVPGNAPYGANPMAGPASPRGPAVVTPQPNQSRLLPAQAGPAGVGIPPGRNITVTGSTQPPHGTIPLPAQFGQPLLGSGEGNPEFVTPPASYPPLNEPTAQTSVNAGTPRQAQEPIPQRTINVSPEGQAAIQRRALPAPETHAFSQKAWKAQHPNGNLKSALKQAHSKGYRIVD